MKKTAIALSLSLFALSAQAVESNHFYLGFKSGWSSLHQGVKQLSELDYLGNGQNVNQYQVKRNSIAYGLYAGYQFNPYLSLEGGYEHFGQVKVSSSAASDSVAFKHSAQGAILNLKTRYPLTERLDIFAKAGAALVQNRYKMPSLGQNENLKIKQNQVAPLLGTGVEYHIAPELSLRFDYQWLPRITKAKTDENTLSPFSSNVRYRPDAHSLTVGLLYRFGVAEHVEVESVRQHIEFNADVLFDFDKSNLKPEAFTMLDDVYTNIEQQNLNNTQVNVNGYADRLGSQAYNLKLSQKRADNVASYLLSKGDAFENVVAQGYGSSTEKTGNQCDNIRNRKELIQCLAPDRRVTLDITGTKME